MESIQNTWIKQLREICKVTGAYWAAWLWRANSRWEISELNALSKPMIERLQSFLEIPKTSQWLAGALSSGRTRWCSAEESALDCQRIYIFPNTAIHELLIVGGPHLSKTNERLFKAIALFNPARKPGELPTESQNHAASTWQVRAELESSYNPQAILYNSLEFLAKLVGCEAAYLAIRTGDIYRIQSAWNCSQVVKNFELSLKQISPLDDITRSRRGIILHSSDLQRIEGLPTVTEKTPLVWMGVPILVSQRVIGFTAFVSSSQEGYNLDLVGQVAQQIEHLAYHIENAIIFSEAAHYLEQMALLNELASTLSASVELNEVSRRMMQRLRRAFDIDWAAVFLLSLEAKVLKEYGGSGRSASPRNFNVADSLVGQTIITGLPLRVNDVRKEGHLLHSEPGGGSELAVPLKYRGNLIGAIDLFSKEINAFSPQDEQLLNLIAGHLAGLFENMRLNQEAREKAQKLQETVLELRAVRETALDITSALDLDILLTRIAHRAQVLVDARGAELGLLDEKEQIVKVVVSVTPWESQPDDRIPLMAGVAGRMAVFGEPMIVPDYNTWPGRMLHEQVTPFKSVAGVPLMFKGQVIGTLTVMDDRPERIFIEEDVRLLELLAPQAAISIRNAQLYQELQERIAAQQLAESHLVRSARLAAVGEMAAGVAHELNNPLTTVTGFVELVLENLPPTSENRSDLELVLQEALRARDVVRRLLDFSRPTEFQKIPTDPCALVDQVISLVSHQIRTGGVQLVVDRANGLPKIFVDPGQIKQVLLNLTHNALQAMPSGGILTMRTCLETYEGSDWVVLSVKDTGEGISPENLERIFQPFFTTRQNKGTGLGLSVSYGIVQSHKGFIDVHSQVNQGSTFKIYLPVKIEE